MSAIRATEIRLRRSYNEGESAPDLIESEIAVNVTDDLLYVGTKTGTKMLKLEDLPEPLRDSLRNTPLK